MNVYEARKAGREYCQTEGSDHYKEGGVEPLDLAIAKGTVEDFAITNMSKYAFRFKITRNLEDLKKVADYAHILCGVELGKKKPDICDTCKHGDGKPCAKGWPRTVPVAYCIDWRGLK